MISTLGVMAANIGRGRVCAAIALWISVTAFLSACSTEVAAPPVMVAPPQPAPPPQFSPFATPAQVHAEIVRWFSAAGYHQFQVEALAQHAKIESGFRPCAAGARDLRYTYQWGGTRLQHLYQFAGTRTCPPLDWQLAFADHELKTDPKFWCFWRTTTRSGALAALRRGFGAGSC